ncbi:death domain-containing protein CRADD [Biomphalaria pfeifferi]|uniref:Death domain-containing protein CRADD n=1 Tax=Biomphalaria pfeifferi TaxID=112525 RepID=A0AAD8C7I7_BIOPF|nr:death domain-containing protein CRADD [Biomphalaria pfeifferi]
MSASYSESSLSYDSESRIQQNWIFLLDELDEADIVDHLFEAREITRDQIDEIESKPTKRKKTEALLKFILQKKKQKLYDVFVETLKIDYIHVVDKLNATKVIPAEPKVAPYDWFKDIPNSKKQLALRESDASRFSNCFGSGWEAIMYSLGIKKTELELELENVGHRKKQTITNLIIRWKQRNGKSATLEKFMNTVINVSIEDRVTLDWEELKKCVDRMSPLY